MITDRFKVGDAVYCSAFGKGTVVAVITVGLSKPVIVRYSQGNKDYTLDGRLEPWGAITLVPIPEINSEFEGHSFDLRDLLK